MSVVDLKSLVIFDKSIVLSNSGETQDNNGEVGQLRFNNNTYHFEGYHSNAGADIFGNIWRPLTQDVASTSNLGVIRIGNNLLINPTTGILSAVASGESRIYQLVITVSPILNAADFQTINAAISNAIGTPAGGYIDGSVTSNIGSPPSAIYPFVIQLGPGQYSEALNQIVLPDYVSLKGEDNYNSVITQNAGNVNITTGSMIILGQNCAINNLVVNLADASSSQVSNALYSLNKSNVTIDSCIFTCNTNINTTSSMYNIIINGGTNNKISNSQFIMKNNNAITNIKCLDITNTSLSILNNSFDISIPNATNSTAIQLNNCNDTESILDKTYIDGITISNNYYSTVSGKTNYGISLYDSSVSINNSIIEVSNDPSITTNYGIAFNSIVNLSTITSNIVSFNSTNNTLISSNISLANFVTAGFIRGQHISITNSTNNNGIYKIKSVDSSSQITLESNFRLLDETASGLVVTTIKALYTADITNTNIKASTYNINNINANSNYIFNTYNVITDLATNIITPSYIFYTTYKTITVGKANCNYSSLVDAMNSITDSSSNTRYIIKIQSGIYQENNVVICKQYVDIEGSGIDSTILQFSRYDITGGNMSNQATCIIITSNMSISNLAINNNSIINTAGSTSINIYGTNILNITLENLYINANCNSNYNNGIYLNGGDNIYIKNANITISNSTNITNYGYQLYHVNNFKFYNISITISAYANNNYGIYNTRCNGDIYNPSINANIGALAFGIYSISDILVHSLIQIYNGQIKANDYSIHADNYYTFICIGVQLFGDTYTSTTESRIFCTGCYEYQTNTTNVQSLNSRGQNEQSQYSTITIGDTAGKLNSTGIENIIVGVNAGSNVTTASYSTIIGSNAGKSITTANNNTLLGSNTGKSITTGSYNTITGSNAGININIGSKNVINGYDVANSLTTGSQNILIGNETAATLTTGNLNVYIGHSAGSNSITSNTNTFIGAFAGNSDQTGNDNTYIGYQSGNSSIIANDNIMIGRQSGYNNLSNSIVSIGNYAGYNNTSSISNTYLGTNSGYNNTTGDGNTYLGKKSGYSTPSASGGFNTAIGNEAGYSLTSGSRNVLVGSTTSSNGTSNDSAGWSLTSGNDNVHIGVSAGNSATSAINNVIIGSSIGTAITTAANNVLIGQNTGNTLDTNGQNVIIGTNAGSSTNTKAGNNAGNAVMIGYQAGAGYTGSEGFAIGYQAGANISGDYNMFMGYNSGGLPKLDTTGAYNIAIGPYTGFNLTSGARNIIVGSGDSGGSAGKLISTGSDNTLLGYKSGSALQTGSGNSLFGSNAGANLTSGLDNLILGYQSAFNLNSGSYNVILGPQAGYNLNNGVSNIYAGYQSGYNNISGGYNINMGYQAGFEATGNSYNIHLGHRAGYSSTADKNIILGYQAGQNNTTGTNNIFIGLEAGAGVNANNEQIGTNNIFIGKQAGYSNDNGYNNIFLGSNVGLNNIDGSKNIFIGENAGSLSSTSHNIFIGTSSTDGAGVGYNSTNTGEYNVFIGHDVGIQNTIGQNNIFLGDKAGNKNVEGKENIYIGTKAGQNTNGATANYNIAIGSDAGINNQNGTENILIGRKVAGLTTGINYDQNIIIGSKAGQYIDQDNQIFIGTNSGQLNTTGDRNVFIGLNSGKNNNISNDNVVIGSDAGVSLIGNGVIGGNTIIGTEAGHDLLTGTNNIYIGSSAGSTATTSINNVVIGANAMLLGNGDNVIIIGNNAGKNNNANDNIFIGSNSGVQNTTGIANIFIGNESGYAVTTSNGNIIFGKQAASTGRIADNNIVFGNECAKGVTNKSEFTNNIVMGSSAGKTSNLAINSIMIGTNTVGLGTGGDVNIIMGNNSAVNLGDQHNVYPTTLTQITTLITYTTINIPFGSGTYYFNYGDTIIVESLNNDYIFQTKIVALISDNDNIGNNGKTKIVFANKPTQVIPIGSILYVKNIKESTVGTEDYSKSSSNMCIGDQCGYELTTGSKNSAIGDSSMFQNQVGRYNITLGTESGYSLNTDNNLCLGIKAGYSLDSFKDTTTTTDFAFYQSNNTITSSTKDFSSYTYGTVFDINGSSSNDGRYNVFSRAQNYLTVQGFPNIIENGFQNVSYGFIVNSSQYSYINFSFATQNIVFNTFQITIFGINPSTFDINDLQYATYITITNSQFNNGIKMIDFNRSGGIFSSGSGQITFCTVQNNYVQAAFTEPNNVTLSINVICYRNSINKNSFNCNIFQNDKINILISKFNGAYKISNDMPYFLENGNPDLTEVKGVIVNTPLETYSDTINQINIKGKTSPSSLVSKILDIENAAIFQASDNSLNFLGFPTFSTLVLPCLVYISGTLYNNGYNYITKLTNVTSCNIYFDANFPIIDENAGVLPGTIRVIELQNQSIFGEIYTSNTEFLGNIISIKYRNNLYQNYTFGSYVIEKFYKDNLALNNNLIKYYSSNASDVSMNITFCDNAIKTITNDYISSNDLIFQTSNISFSNITFTNSTSTITTLIDYEFVNIIAPVIIKISGTSNNNGFYLVTQNNSPYKTLLVDSVHHSLVNETASSILIKTKCISSYLSGLNLSYLLPNKEYEIFGSKYNDETKFLLYNDSYAKSNVSVYLDDNTTIVNDTYNDYYYSVVNSPTGNLAYGTACNKGVMFNFTLSNISVTSNTAISLIFTDTSTNFSSTFAPPITIGSTACYINDSYLTLSNTIIGGATGSYDGLYWINTIQYLGLNQYKINFNTSFIRNNIKYTATNPFTGAVTGTSTVLVNQFVFINNQIPITFDGSGVSNFPVYNLDWTKYITGFGENAKYISFTPRNGCITFAGGSYNPSDLLGTVSNNKSLTFEIASYALNTSSNAIAFVETCPSTGLGYFDESIKSYIINFGVPNPSTRTSDIYRPNLRPIMYSNQNFVRSGILNCNSNVSLNTISVDGTYLKNNFAAFNSYGKTYLYPNFAMLYPGQVFYLNNASNQGFYLVKSVSENKLTLYLDSAYSTLLSTQSYGGLEIYTNYTIYDPSVDFTKFVPSTFTSTDYQIMTFKYPTRTGLNSTRTGWIQDKSVSELYFPINKIDITNTSASCLVFDKTYYDNLTSNIAPTKLGELCFNHTLLIPTDNILTNYTNISFHNNTVIGSSDISFYSSNNTITSIATNLSSFLTSEYILVSGTVSNNFLYRINDSISPTSNTIVVSSEYTLANESNKSATIKANCINSSNVVNTDLSVFSYNQVLIVSQTSNNNTTYTSNISSNSQYSIYCDTPNVVTEVPEYCSIRKSILINEVSSLQGISNINFSNSAITLSNNALDLSGFRTGQKLQITGTTFNNSNVTISDSIIPSNISITIDETLVNESNTSALLRKKIDFTVIGEPIQSVITENYSSVYNYEDAEGNNSIIGSFAGQYIGALNNSIYNVVIGSRCGQINHGSGNILLGSESKLAISATDIGFTTYNNKFVVYKNNLTGIPLNPLISGEFQTGRVGINTINTESIVSAASITVTDTKLIINGGALANSFSPFTGCHIVNFANSNIASSIIPGMIVSTTGKVFKPSVINIFCTVAISNISCDKAVFGVYAYSETTNKTSESEYIINSSGKYVYNENYNDNSNIETLHYAAAIGEGSVLVTNINGEVQNGDYITTSLIEGYGALQNDDILHSYTVAKCTETIDWDSLPYNINYNGQDYKSYLSGCTYHSG
jgi:hypothetical protein